MSAINQEGRGVSKITSHHSPLETEEILWEKWKKEKDEYAANELVRSYMYLVTYHVDRISVNLPKSVSRDDLESFAFMGLFDAIKKFEPERELKFDTYASFRIRGSIIDGLRKEDWLPRSLREKAKKIEDISQQLEQRLQRTPSSAEIAEQLNMKAEDVETIINDSLFANVLSIDGKRHHELHEHDEEMAFNIPDEEALEPDEYMLNKEIQEILVEKIQKLNKNEQMVVSLFYYDGLTMTEIGEVLNLTTSRISQIHKSAIFKLRKALNKLQFGYQI